MYTSVHTMNFEHVMSRRQVNYGLLLKLRRQYLEIIIWDKVFETGPSKISGYLPLKDLKRCRLLKADHTSSNFLKAVFHKFNLVSS